MGAGTGGGGGSGGNVPTQLWALGGAAHPTSKRRDGPSINFRSTYI